MAAVFPLVKKYGGLAVALTLDEDGIGGAVLTQEYADRIGADRYARDAMETVRYAQAIMDRLEDEQRITPSYM